MQRSLLVLPALLMIVDLYLIFFFAPRERVMGDVQRIFYFHVPLAWNAFFAFGITFVMSLRYLWSRRLEDDHWAAAAAEVGLVFTTLVLITGSLWARSAWGAYWTWEPRLTTAFVLWLMYLFYLILGRYVETPERARLLRAAYGIVVFVNVPIVFMSIRWWRTIHPVLIEGGKFKMEPAMVLTLCFSLLTFTALCALYLCVRVRLRRMENEVESVNDRIKEGMR